MNIAMPSAARTTSVKFGMEPPKPIQILKDHLTAKKIPFEEIIEGVQDGKKTYDIFVAKPAHVSAVLEGLKDLHGIKPHAEDNKLKYHQAQVGVWVNTRFELFDPNK